MHSISRYAATSDQRAYLAILDARLPVTRFAPTVGNRHDANDIAISTENKGVRKAAKWDPAVDRIEFLAERRQLDGHTSNAFDFQDEVSSESASLPS
jgi:hypothetical protein